jgi:phytoene dehydrogenase-like protein
VRLKKGTRIRAKRAVVSNASGTVQVCCRGMTFTYCPLIPCPPAAFSSCTVWDTLKLLPEGSLKPQVREDLDATPKTPSFLHLHLGIDATGLPKDLDCHHTVINTWDKIDDPQNMAIISIPTTLDPSLAPPGEQEAE